MHRRTMLAGLAGLLLASRARAAAQMPWLSLSRRLLPRRLRLVALDLPFDTPPLRAVRLTVTGGSLRLRTITLRFADGRREQHLEPLLLRRGESSPAFPIGPGQRLLAVRVEFAPFTGGRYLLLTGLPLRGQQPAPSP